MQTFSVIIDKTNPEDGLRKLDEQIANATNIENIHSKDDEKWHHYIDRKKVFCQKTTTYRKIKFITDTAIKLDNYDILFIRAVEFEITRSEDHYGRDSITCGKCGT